MVDHTLSKTNVMAIVSMHALVDVLSSEQFYI